MQSLAQLRMFHIRITLGLSMVEGKMSVYLKEDYLKENKKGTAGLCSLHMQAVFAGNVVAQIV